jgi:hypothetical protein
MEEKTVSVTESFFERLVNRVFDRSQEDAPKADNLTAGVNLEEFSALQARKAELEAEIVRLQNEQEFAARLDKFSAKIASTKVAMDGAALMLASMTSEQAEWTLTQFKALSAQIDESQLTAGIGKSGVELSTDPQEKLNVAIKARMAANNTDYLTAFNQLREQDPELFKIL